jgi:group I intron endonuclease
MQKHRISTNIGRDQKVIVELKNDFDLLEIIFKQDFDFFEISIFINMEYLFKNRCMINGMCCVYIIKNILNNKVYVGSAFNIKKRLIQHYNLLKNNKHSNIKLQRGWNKYGEDNFRIQIMEENRFNDLLNKEQEYINFYNSVEEGYNITPIAGSTLGNKWTTQQKEKYSVLKKKLQLGEPVIQYDLNGKKINEFPNMKIAGKSIGIKNTCLIGQCCRKEKKTVGGFKWEYKNKEKQKIYGKQEFPLNKKINCPHCNGTKTKKAGFIVWNDNKKQQYRCDICSKRFSETTNKPNAWNVDVERNEKIINLYLNNIKSRDISKEFGITRETVNRVIRKWKIQNIEYGRNK